jgi:hypothetical protein
MARMADERKDKKEKALKEDLEFIKQAAESLNQRLYEMTTGNLGHKRRNMHVVIDGIITAVKKHLGE